MFIKTSEHNIIGVGPSSKIYIKTNNDLTLDLLCDNFSLKTYDDDNININLMHIYDDIDEIFTAISNKEEIFIMKK